MDFPTCFRATKYEILKPWKRSQSFGKEVLKRRLIHETLSETLLQHLTRMRKLKKRSQNCGKLHSISTAHVGGRPMLSKDMEIYLPLHETPSNPRSWQHLLRIPNQSSPPLRP